MKRIALLLALFIVFGTSQTEAQILKGFGKKLEKKIEQRIDRKADRHVDKVIDKADKKTDKPIDDVIDGKSSKKSDKKTSSTEIAAKTERSKAPSIATEKMLSDGLLVMPTGNCSDFIWFKSGAMMEFEIKDGDGEYLFDSKTEILSVTTQGDMVVANAQVTSQEGNEMEMQFKCEGDKMYMDMSSLIKSAMANAGQSGADEAQLKNALENTEIGMSDGFMSFPKEMYPGQELDDVSFVMITQASPQLKMEFLSKTTDRKVTSKEKITLPAGSFDCVKITSRIETSMKVMGMNKKMDPIIEHVWFAPGIGIIKQESYNEKGKLSTIMQLKSYKL